MRLVSYSDLHYHSYSNGLSLNDVGDVESEIPGIVKAVSADMVVFCGDRFVSRNPHYDVLYKATAVLDSILNNLDGKPFIYLIGNHDQTVKNHLGSNTAEHLKLSKYPNLHIIDQRGSYTIGGVTFHAVPAETENAKAEFVMGPGLNICLYHGMIKNAKYDTGILDTNGHDCSFLDDSRFDLVVCGDNHMHQRLDMFNNVEAWYVGATMQHKWAESGTKRGFMQFDLDGTTVVSKHIESKAPKFIVLNVSADTDVFKYLVDRKETIEGNLVRLIVTGTGTQLESLDNKVIKEYIYKIGAKHAEVKPDYVFEQVVYGNIPVMTEEEEWKKFISDSPDRLGDLDPNIAFELGKKYIND